MTAAFGSLISVILVYVFVPKHVKHVKVEGEDSFHGLSIMVC